MTKHKDKTGQKIGRWYVLARKGVHERHKYSEYYCVCDCGTFRITNPSERSLSCGCLAREKRLVANTKHGLYRSREYRIYLCMIQRCTNPKNTKYHLYGGRGITVSSSWKESFENFMEDMGRIPDGETKLTLDRIDVSKGYSVENCRWASYTTQSFNTRQRITNSSGKSGVAWRPDKQKWRARISVEHMDIFLGHFDTFEEAVQARQAAELVYYGVYKDDFISFEENQLDSSS